MNYADGNRKACRLRLSGFLYRVCIGPSWRYFEDFVHGLRRRERRVLTYAF